MIPAQEELERIIKELQAKMRIQDWDIDVDTFTTVEYIDRGYGLDGIAFCEPDRKRKSAYIGIHIQHRNIEEQWYHAIVHELTHILADDCCAYIQDVLREELNDKFSAKWERLVDNIARAFRGAEGKDEQGR